MTETALQRAASSKLDPYREELLSRRQRGDTLPLLIKYLATEHGVSVSKGYLSQYLRNFAEQSPTPPSADMVFPPELQHVMEQAETLAELRQHAEDSALREKQLFVKMNELEKQCTSLVEVVRQSLAAGTRRAPAAPSTSLEDRLGRIEESLNALRTTPFTLADDVVLRIAMRSFLLSFFILGFIALFAVTF